MNRHEVTAFYQAKLDQQLAIIRQALKQWKAVSYLRGITFLASVAALILGLVRYSNFTSLCFALAGLLFLAFLVVAFIHEGMQSQLKIATLLSNMHRESLARLDRRWKDIQVPKIDVPGALTAVSADLDLFTETSVYKLLAITRTPNGIETLRRWIAEGAGNR
jgi:hypothetical protein